MVVVLALVCSQWIVLADLPQVDTTFLSGRNGISRELLEKRNEQARHAICGDGRER